MLKDDPTQEGEYAIAVAERNKIVEEIANLNETINLKIQGNTRGELEAKLKSLKEEKIQLAREIKVDPERAKIIDATIAELETLKLQKETFKTKEYDKERIATIKARFDKIKIEKINIMSNCLVAQSGGPSSVINATVAGVVKANQMNPYYDKVYGGLNGIEGILKER